MTYALAYGHCFGCKQVFSFNPLRVPSIPIKGVREPICETCVKRVNPERKKRGLDPIVPAPDAYQALDAEELP